MCTAGSRHQPRGMHLDATDLQGGAQGAAKYAGRGHEGCPRRPQHGGTADDGNGGAFRAGRRGTSSSARWSRMAGSMRARPTIPENLVLR